MTVDELRAALADLPGEAKVEVWAMARCSGSEEIHVVGVGVDGDGVLKAFLDIEDDTPARLQENGYYR